VRQTLTQPRQPFTQLRRRRRAPPVGFRRTSQHRALPTLKLLGVKSLLAGYPHYAQVSVEGSTAPLRVRRRSPVIATQFGAPYAKRRALQLPIRLRSGIQRSWSLASALLQLLFELRGEVVVGTTPLPALELLAEQTQPSLANPQGVLRQRRRSGVSSGARCGRCGPGIDRTRGVVPRPGPGPPRQPLLDADRGSRLRHPRRHRGHPAPPPRPHHRSRHNNTRRTRSNRRIQLTCGEPVPVRGALTPRLPTFV